MCYLRVVKHLLIFILSISFLSCNVVQWNQNRLSKKFERKGIHEGYYETEDHHVHYWEGGEGDTVVLIHGFGADGQMTWNTSIQDLVKDHYVFVPDLLWFGESHSKKEANLTSQIDAMYALLDHKGISHFKLVGISYGGFVVLGMTYQRPESIEKLVIVDSPGMTYNIDLLDSLCVQEGVERVQDIFVVRDAPGVHKLLEVTSIKPKKVSDKILQSTYEVYFDQHHDELDALLETLPAEKDKFGELPENFPPSVVIWGRQDWVFPLGEGEKLAKYLGGEIKVVENAGHAINFDNFKSFEFYLREFLDN